MEKFNIKNIKAIIGLGNPGQKYYKNRHNIGFRVIDEIANKYFASWKSLSDMDISEINIDSCKIYLVKPLTYMNACGKIIPSLTKKGIKAEEILVIHDELEKKFGSQSIVLGGSARGHNGLRSIISVIGPNFWRFRFGIGRPDDKSEVSEFVLSNFTKDQELEINNLISDALIMILNQ